MRASIKILVLLALFADFNVIGEDKAKKDVMSVEYNSSNPYPSHGITMAGALRALGITLEKIDYLKLVGDESSLTSGLEKKVKIDELFWDRYFETAEPYKYWLSSGNRRLQVFVKGETKPKTTIYINETDSSCLDGDTRELRYMCRGLEKWFMKTLTDE